MKYILVNNRFPRGEINCAWCCERITDGYLREIATRIFYHDCYCYFQHVNISVLRIENQARMQ